jgi:P-type conjugative transfer protein TrbG
MSNRTAIGIAILIISFFLLIFGGCTAQRSSSLPGQNVPYSSATLPSSPAVPTSTPQAPDSTPAPAAPTADTSEALIAALPAEVRDAMRVYLRTGRAPVCKSKTKAKFLWHPYQEGVQVPLTCRSLGLCTVKLQAGEVIKDVVNSDKVHWLVKPLRSGADDQETPSLVVKPKYNDIASADVVVGTNKRIYYLYFTAQPGAPLMTAQFYYPQEIRDQVNESRREVWRKPVQASGVFADTPLSILDFGYRIEGDAPWKPLRVADDGKKTYLEMPLAMMYAGAPLLYAQKRTGKKGKLMQITSRLTEDGFIVADGIFDTLELRLGSGDEMERVTVTRGI